MADFVIFSGPRGAGKGMLVDTVGKEFPHLTRLVSHTTRKKRNTEVNGASYHFVDRDAYYAKRDAGKFLWDMPYGDNRYALGVEQALAPAVALYADVHPGGARYLRLLAGTHGHRILLIAVLAPEFLRRKRIALRQPELSCEQVERMMAEDTVPGFRGYFRDYDLVIVNDGPMETAQAATIDAVRRFLRERT